jgi:Ca-activated chloride channel family protein
MRLTLHTARSLLLVACAGVLTASVGCAGSADSGGYASGNYNGNGGTWSNIGTGGAQDIGQFRQILDQGGIPGENTLDANGFFSEHYTQLPAPECGQLLCLHGMLAVSTDWTLGAYQATLQVAMSSPIDPATLVRQPLDLVVVVDTSGSMAEAGKLEYVKLGLDVLVDQLHEGDRIALVRYATDVSVVAPLGAMDATGLHGVVAGLLPSGSTNFYGALETGLALAAEVVAPERQVRVLILSDGLPTTGNTDENAILGMAEGYLEDGIGLTTVGVGLEFNVNLMRGLAERGAGNFYFIEDPAAVQDVFVQELDYFVTPIAFDLEVEVVTGAGYTLGEVVGTNLWSTDGYRGTISIPSVFLASRTSAEDPPVGEGGRRGGGSAILIQMVPNPAWAELADPYRVAEITLSYRLPEATERTVQVVSVANPEAPGVAAELPYYTHEAMAKNHAMYNVFLGLREAARYASYSYNYALWTLVQTRSGAAAWNASRYDEDIEADLALIDEFVANLEERGAYATDPSQPTYTPDYPYQDPCAQGGCDDQEQDEGGLFFGCAATGNADGAPLMGVVLLALGLLWRRRRIAA